jgi:hypothetical protein
MNNVDAKFAKNGAFETLFLVLETRVEVFHSDNRFFRRQRTRDYYGDTEINRKGYELIV